MPESRSRPRELLVNLAVLLVTLVVCLLLTELGLRAGQKIFGGTPFGQSLSDLYDADLGWRGRQVFGDPETGRPRILVIGDSYTEGAGVPPRDLYYSVLGRELDAEVFAYGGGGYGTLQEYIVLDRFFDRIRPDLVILQVCRNDYINNDQGLQDASWFNNNPMIRPYLVNGGIELVRPDVPLFGQSRAGTFLLYHSRLVYYLTKKINKIGAILSVRGIFPSVEHEIAERGLGVPGFASSVATTREIVRMFAARVGSTPLIAFPVDTEEPMLTQFREAFAASGVPFIEHVPVEIERREAAGENMRTTDFTHWNEAGHEIAGRELAEVIRESGWLGTERP